MACILLKSYCLVLTARFMQSPPIFLKEKFSLHRAKLCTISNRYGILHVQIHH